MTEAGKPVIQSVRDARRLASHARRPRVVEKIVRAAEPTTTPMRDRLEDIDDLLLQDVSPREAWAEFAKEHLMRRELARELQNRANSMYTVDQEAAEKETDIRLRTTCSSQQATIELKIGEKPRSAAVLRMALKDQLLKKYMAAEDCRAGCLVVTIRSNKTWTHPETRTRLDLGGLIAMLNEEASRLTAELGGSIRLMAKGLDLRPRLKTERAATAKRKKSKPRKSVPKAKKAIKKTGAAKRRKPLAKQRQRPARAKKKSRSKKSR
jgi:hypothetical protein